MAIVEKKKQSGTKKAKSKKKSSKKDKKSNGGAGLSNVLAKQLEKKQRKKEKGRRSKEKSLRETKRSIRRAVANKNNGDVESKFDAKHIKIVNRTYYDRNMKRLGPKKMRYASVKQNQNTGEWDPRIYILKFDEHSGGGKPEETWLEYVKLKIKLGKRLLWVKIKETEVCSNQCQLFHTNRMKSIFKY